MDGTKINWLSKIDLEFEQERLLKWPDIRKSVEVNTWYDRFGQHADGDSAVEALSMTVHPEEARLLMSWHRIKNDITVRNRSWKNSSKWTLRASFYLYNTQEK